MRFRVKLLSFNEPASDGSRVSREVVESYMATEDFRNAIASKKLLGTLTHYPRSSANTKNLPPTISKTVGKDDLMLMVGEASPTHYITGLECGKDGWLYAEAEVLNTEGLDDCAIQNIKRLRGLLGQGIMIGVSAVILGYWDNSNYGGDFLKKLVCLKGFDLTLNPSWKKGQVVEIEDDNGELIASVYDDRRNDFNRLFSDTETDSAGLKAKIFSDVESLGFSDYAKTSKIDGKFTTLKAKQFSFTGYTDDLLSGKPEVKEEQKEYTVTTVKERIRYAKFSPRMRFRRLFIDYKQVVRSMGGTEKIDPDTLRIMKSLFASDVLDIIKAIHSDVLAGKQINTLIGASSLGKNVRVAAQNLQLPYRFAMTEVAKTNKISPMRYQKIQAAYAEFIRALTDEVFGPTPLPQDLEKEAEEEEGGEK